MQVTLRKILISCCVLFLTSCANYYIPVESFREQFGKFKDEDMRDVTTAGPVPGVAMGSYKVKYKTYPVSEVKCVDGKGQPHVMYMLPSIEMHITEVDGKKTVFYLDMTKVSNDTLYGTKSRMLGFLKASIPMNRIKKIKVVNNHMSFHYTDY